MDCDSWLNTPRFSQLVFVRILSLSAFCLSFILLSRAFVESLGNNSLLSRDLLSSFSLLSHSFLFTGKHWPRQWTVQCPVEEHSASVVQERSLSLPESEKVTWEFQEPVNGRTQENEGDYLRFSDSLSLVLLLSSHSHVCLASGKPMFILENGASWCMIEHNGRSTKLFKQTLIR